MTSNHHYQKHVKGKENLIDCGLKTNYVLYIAQQKTNLLKINTGYSVAKTYEIAYVCTIHTLPNFAMFHKVRKNSIFSPCFLILIA